ncbi:urease accessory protein UreD [Arsenicitalea aurantiaca]|uniref:Urease accessory protein UreD n=1 Tax=Arsenicitalea aurantiaca TaxID=1783274 RepID=A0A433XLX5_9HYPH|nr:urease accessory protein UreD [Arsenicitalea aurantiaca]RUT35085.1 urease accessory protein UreD [Arsenicitalea aurantiaca]
MAVALPREPLLPPRHQRARGEGRISAAPRDGRTRLRTLYQEGCAKIRLPNAHGRAIEAVMINTAGGLCGGDAVQWGVEADAGASMVLTTQACERVYRSTGPVATLGTRISVGADAHVDWLPQETILFEDARLDRSLEIDLAPGASVCALEAVLLGREAMGEGARNAHLRDRWRIRREGRLVHAESTLLSADALERDGLSLLDGAIAFATLVYIGPGADRRLEPVRAALPAGARAAASLIGEKLVLRALAPSGLALRRIIAPTVAIMSGAGSLPRLWHL